MSKYSDQLRERIKKNQENRGFTGGGFLNTSEHEDVQYFKPKEGRNSIYILPYLIATKHHPQGFEKGKVDYLLDVWVHRNIGLGNDSVICPKLNFKQPCPICEEMDKLKEDDPDSKTAEGLKASRRIVYNVVDKRESDKGIQLFFTNHYHFEKELLDASSNSEEGEGLIPFSDPESGYVIKFRAVEETFQKRKFFKFKDFNFEKGESQFEEDIVEQTYPLDKMMILHSYEEIQKIFYGGSSEEKKDEDDEEESPRESKKSIFKKEKGNKKEDDEDEPVKKKETLKSSDGEYVCRDGHTFGKNCDEFKECKTCKVWEECANEFEKVKKGKK